MGKDRIVRGLRINRVYHRYLGIFLCTIVVVSAVTGILLSYKKQVNWIQPPTQKGSTKSLSDWLPLYQLEEKALKAFQIAQPDEQHPKIDRMDVRPSKGIAKILLKDNWWEIQINGQTGDILSIQKRHSDWIEAIHDGSIISEIFKLISMNILGFGLLVLSLTGFWLWYGPKYFRKLKESEVKK
ncbi:MAG: PepSY domain-containing protein [Saprospiraceae bacterium]|nr:PepSY domain-containing protein [Saprospiraceae bacterium]